MINYLTELQIQINDNEPFTALQSGLEQIILAFNPTDDASQNFIMFLAPNGDKVTLIVKRLNNNATNPE